MDPSQIENEAQLRMRPFNRADSLFFLAAFLFIHTQLFQLPFTPIYFEGDHMIGISNAIRMMNGEVIYRDFFHLAPPGIEVVYAFLFSVFGIKIWLLNLVVLLLGFAQVWMLWHFSRQFFTGIAVYFPAALYLIIGFRLFFIDGSYRLLSMLIVLAAAALLMKGRTARNLIIAGSLCAISTFFLHPRGVVGLAGISLFLIWENYVRGFDLKSLIRTGFYLTAPFVLVVVLTQSYFVYQAGVDNYYFSLVTFLQRHYPNDPLAQRTAFLLDFPDLGQYLSIYSPAFAVSRYLRILLPTLFYYLLIPFVYFAFLIVRWRKLQLWSAENDKKLMLLCFVGLAMFVGVSVLSVIRLSHVSIPGFILLVWLLKPLPYFRQIAAVCLVLLAVIGFSYSVQRQTVDKSYIEMPAGRSAFLAQIVFERYRWIGSNTEPGELFYEPYHPSFYFPFYLVNPTPMYVIRDSGYTPLFQVEEVVRSLQSSPPDLIAWPRKWIKPAGSRSEGDNLEILWQFIASNYELQVEFAKPVDYTEHSEGDVQIWKRKY
jgi:hypothetical protein